ncbi:Uncharacterised protein [Mycobacteroides abscessus]|nr:Uncharacterised protein [Mycobacteroides abscessus]
MWSRLVEFARPPFSPLPGGGHCRSTGSIVTSSIWTVTSTRYVCVPPAASSIPEATRFAGSASSAPRPVQSGFVSTPSGAVVTAASRISIPSP